MKKKKVIIPALSALALAGGFLIWNSKEDKAVEVDVNELNKLVQEYKIPEVTKNIEDKYDLVVVGGEPEGVVAAISAARNGVKVLLIEEKEELGGLFTYGMLNFLDLPFDDKGKTVSEGIFKEWHELVGNKYAFGITEAKAAFLKMVEAEENITLLTQTEVKEAVMEGNKVVGLTYENENGSKTVNAESFIDATQDADFAVLANAPHFVGGEDAGMPDKKMAVTLMLHLKNVDWEGVKETAKSQKFGSAEVDDSVAWGFEDLHKVYQAKNENTRLRGLNLVRIGDDYYINALQIFGIDGLSEESKQKAIELGKSETDHILEFLQKEFKGFENAEVASYPTELYVRETRHVESEYQLPMSDVWTNEDHWDNVGWAAYPVDVQAQTVHDFGYVLANPKQYAIPFRSLVPLEVDGLLVVGRATGYSSLAAGSARVVPTGMVGAEAAGVAVDIAQENDVTFRELSKNKELVEELREQLDEQGAYVDHKENEYPYKGEWYDESIQYLIDFGLVTGGYKNDVSVDAKVSNMGLANLLNSGILRTNPDSDEKVLKSLQDMYNSEYGKEKREMTYSESIAMLSKVFGVEGEAGLIKAGLLKESTVKNINKKDNEILVNKDLYAMLADVLKANAEK